MRADTAGSREAAGYGFRLSPDVNLLLKKRGKSAGQEKK